MYFESISNSHYFRRTDFILLFTQMDEFREKISSGFSSIQRHFPDYNGAPTDVEAAQAVLHVQVPRRCSRQEQKIVLSLRKCYRHGQSKKGDGVSRTFYN